MISPMSTNLRQKHDEQHEISTLNTQQQQQNTHDNTAPSGNSNNIPSFKQDQTQVLIMLEKSAFLENLINTLYLEKKNLLNNISLNNKGNYPAPPNYQFLSYILTSQFKSVVFKDGTNSVGLIDYMVNIVDFNKVCSVYVDCLYRYLEWCQLVNLTLYPIKNLVTNKQVLKFLIEDQFKYLYGEELINLNFEALLFFRYLQEIIFVNKPVVIYTTCNGISNDEIDTEFGKAIWEPLDSNKLLSYIHKASVTSDLIVNTNNNAPNYDYYENGTTNSNEENIYYYNKDNNNTNNNHLNEIQAENNFLRQKIIDLENHVNNLNGTIMKLQKIMQNNSNRGNISAISNNKLSDDEVVPPTENTEQVSDSGRTAENMVNSQNGSLLNSVPITHNNKPSHFYYSGKNLVAKSANFTKNTEFHSSSTMPATIAPEGNIAFDTSIANNNAPTHDINVSNSNVLGPNSTKTANSDVNNLNLGVTSNPKMLKTVNTDNNVSSGNITSNAVENERVSHTLENDVPIETIQRSDASPMSNSLVTTNPNSSSVLVQQPTLNNGSNAGSTNIFPHINTNNMDNYRRSSSFVYFNPYYNTNTGYNHSVVSFTSGVNNNSNSYAVNGPAPIRNLSTPSLTGTFTPNVNFPTGTSISFPQQPQFYTAFTNNPYTLNANNPNFMFTPAATIHSNSNASANTINTTASSINYIDTMVIDKPDTITNTAGAISVSNSATNIPTHVINVASDDLPTFIADDNNTTTGKRSSTSNQMGTHKRYKADSASPKSITTNVNDNGYIIVDVDNTNKGKIQDFETKDKYKSDDKDKKRDIYLYKDQDKDKFVEKSDCILKGTIANTDVNSNDRIYGIYNSSHSNSTAHSNTNNNKNSSSNHHPIFRSKAPVLTKGDLFKKPYDPITGKNYFFVDVSSADVDSKKNKRKQKKKSTNENNKDDGLILTAPCPEFNIQLEQDICNVYNIYNEYYGSLKIQIEGYTRDYGKKGLIKFTKKRTYQKRKALVALIEKICSFYNDEYDPEKVVDIIEKYRLEQNKSVAWVCNNLNEFKNSLMEYSEVIFKALSEDDNDGGNNGHSWNPNDNDDEADD
ncbi:uncharacterized protein SCODWIG_00044 [Saccharomycodes ludwigii]|uniref:Transcription activator GCR1-like domain-containing protein n=1 Tax=Saccharomycodes ludwigii TaxID=36035 RepID=A0A376B0U9_9ASCO|nr:uncharacterized protein SCODWIG_00044 [Saccharomycodes ludwigii]